MVRFLTAPSNQVSLLMCAQMGKQPKQFKERTNLINSLADQKEVSHDILERWRNKNLPFCSSLVISQRKDRKISESSATK